MAAIERTWADGDAWTAADAYTYFMKQVITVCDNQTDRDAILAPNEGRTVFRKDTDAYEVYNGTEWLTFDTKWQSYAPTYTNLTIGSGTVVANYFRTGKKVRVRWTFVLGSGSAVGTIPEITLPVNRAASHGTDFEQPVHGLAFFLDQPVGRYTGKVTTSSTKFRLMAGVTNATYEQLGDITAAAPIGFVSGDTLGADFEYIAA
jgi:hypothetical protein